MRSNAVACRLLSGCCQVAVSLHFEAVRSGMVRNGEGASFR